MFRCPLAFHLKNSQSGYKNALIDLGEEEFTRGRPHPVIDPTLMKERLWKEGSDPSVAVILLDINLGYGAHEDPAGVLVETIAALKDKASSDGRNLSVVASVCGSKNDPQNTISQENNLKENGVIVMPSNAQASLMSALLLC